MHHPVLNNACCDQLVDTPHRLLLLGQLFLQLLEVLILALPLGRHVRAENIEHLFLVY